MSKTDLLPKLEASPDLGFHDLTMIIYSNQEALIPTLWDLTSKDGVEKRRYFMSQSSLARGHTLDGGQRTTNSCRLQNKRDRELRNFREWTNYGILIQGENLRWNEGGEGESK